MKNKLSALAKGAVVLIAAGVAVNVLAGLLDSYRLASLMSGVVIVELFGSRLGLRWNENPNTKAASSLLTLLRGFGIGAAMSAFIVVFLLVFGLAVVEKSSPALTAITLGLLVAFAEAARDELLYRGIPLTVMQSRIDDRLAIAFVSLLSIMPIFAQPRISRAALLMTFASSLISAVLWRVGKGAFLAWGARAGFVFATSVVLAGGLFDVNFKDSVIAPMNLAHGSAADYAAICMALFASASLFWFSRFRERSQAG